MDPFAFDLVVVAQYFQPAHAGHRLAIEQARSLAKDVVVACLGADCARSIDSPWSSAERVAQIGALVGDGADLNVVTVRDVTYARGRWREALRQSIGRPSADGMRIGVVSDVPIDDVWPAAWHVLLPQAPLASQEAIIRALLFDRDETAWPRIERLLLPAQRAALRAFSGSDLCRELRCEAEFIADFRASWAQAPYPPVFVTTDGIIIWRGELMLIRRARPPGRGLWALPGGFLDLGEALADCLRREVFEEAALQLCPDEMLGTRVFDAPGRSLRGRTITHVYHYDLSARNERPRVVGGDDASEAQWWRLEALRPEMLFEDHYAILQAMLALP